MKKSRFSTAAGVLTAVCIGALALWIAFTLPPARHPVQSLRVKVEPLPEEQAPQGWEKSQVVSVIAPVPLLPGEIVPPARRPQIAIVIDDMGLNTVGSERAVRLPPYVTLSYIPYAKNLDGQTGEARAYGHELLLHVPMEPVGHDNPGPNALLTSLPPEELRVRLVRALRSFEGFDGVNNHMGSKFTAFAPGMEIVADELRRRKLFFLDSRTSAQSVGEAVAQKHGLRVARRDVFLDDDLSAAAIDTQLAQTERIARRRGYAVAIGHPHETTLTALEAWLPAAEKRGIRFVPVHDLARMRPEEAGAGR